MAAGRSNAAVRTSAAAGRSSAAARGNAATRGNADDRSTSTTRANTHAHRTLTARTRKLGVVNGFADALGDHGIGREARTQAGDHGAVKLWLRLLACSTQIEQQIRTRLRERFATTLPRFDYLAQLERHPRGLRMNALSRYLMVTGGNVTALTDQLVADGHVERLPDADDRRSFVVRLTPAGRRHFLRMAGEHEAWLVELLNGFGVAQRDALHDLLGRLRLHLAVGGADDATR